MKFYRGLVDVGKAPVRNQVKRGFKPMMLNKDGRQVEVPKSEPYHPMSAAEIVVLRSLFGPDSITELKEVGEKKNLPYAAERDRLEHLYGEPAITKLFGVPNLRTPLPREIEIEDAYMAIEDRVAAAAAEPVGEVEMTYADAEEPAKEPAEAA